jgi:hypothetical protein
MAHEKRIAGFALAGLACGDTTGDRALAGLTPTLRARAEAAMTELATLDSEGRAVFLRAAAPVVARESFARRADAPELARALAAIAEPARTEAEISLLEESRWLG